MTNKEILEKAIQKAIDGGWEYKLEPDFTASYIALIMDVNRVRMISIIFSHDFAKALWEKSVYRGTNIPVVFQVNQYDMPAWQYHLQQMVISEDPIKYLGENI